MSETTRGILTTELRTDAIGIFENIPESPAAPTSIARRRIVSLQVFLVVMNGSLNDEQKTKLKQEIKELKQNGITTPRIIMDNPLNAFR